LLIILEDKINFKILNVLSFSEAKKKVPKKSAFNSKLSRRPAEIASRDLRGKGARPARRQVTIF